MSAAQVQADPVLRQKIVRQLTEKKDGFQVKYMIELYKGSFDTKVIVATINELCKKKKVAVKNNHIKLLDIRISKLNLNGTERLLYDLICEAGTMGMYVYITNISPLLNCCETCINNTYNTILCRVVTQCYKNTLY